MAAVTHSRCWKVLGLGLSVVLAAPMVVQAQVPPPPPPAQVPPPPPPAQVAPLPPGPAAIPPCIGLQQSVSTLSAEMNQKRQALEGVTRQLSDFDSQLARERSTLNVNDPDAVARYKALLERRDAAYRQSIGPVHSDAVDATSRYNATVNEYNTRCAGPPLSPPPR